MATWQIALPNGARISLARSFPFFAAHVIPLAAFFIGFRWSYLAIFLVMYFVRMFFVTAGYHRYFSHRSFKTSRAFQFIMALVATSSPRHWLLVRRSLADPSEIAYTPATAPPHQHRRPGRGRRKLIRRCSSQARNLWSLP